MPCEVGVEINSLPQNKPIGLYTYPVGILKGACKTLSKPLAILINKAVQSGIYHSRLKNAKIIPELKNENESNPNNYSLMLLLSVFNRIFEKVMYKQIIFFFDKYDILSDSISIWL